jgi:hypothetical protein
MQSSWPTPALMPGNLYLTLSSPRGDPETHSHWRNPLSGSLPGSPAHLHDLPLPQLQRGGQPGQGATLRADACRRAWGPAGAILIRPTPREPTPPRLPPDPSPVKPLAWLSLTMLAQTSTASAKVLDIAQWWWWRHRARGLHHSSLNPKQGHKEA